MTAVEKAKELFDKHYTELPDFAGYQDLETARQCALISVDEIIRELTEEISPSVHGFRHQYWIEVKQEIQKL
jgi:hypothetical protein